MRPFKSLFVFIIFFTLASLSLPVQAQGKGPDPVGLRPDAPTYAKHGPFWVGTREFVIPDKDGKRPLPLTVWYPALNPDGKPEEISYSYNFGAANSVSGHALLNAAMDEKNGPYPLVVFSHGLWGFRYASAYYTEHLASYGFVVVAADHTGDTWVNTYGPSWQAFFINRPKDITRVIDYAESLTAKDGALDGLIDMGQVAVTGHSFGGYTSLAVAPGAQIDFHSVWEFCKSEDVLNLCKQPPSQDELVKLAGLSKTPDSLWPSFGDPRTKTIIPLAPNAVPLIFGQQGLKAVNIPVLLMGSTQDTYVGTGYVTAYNSLGSPQKVMAAFENGDHFLFQNDCKAAPWLLSPPYNLGWYCSDSVWDLDRAHDLINHFTTAFLLDVLKGDKDAHKALLPDAIKFAGIDYKTTLK